MSWIHGLGLRSGELVVDEVAMGRRPRRGTSAAAPQVAGVCALMKQVNPGLTPAEARDYLTRTARDVSAGVTHIRMGPERARAGLDRATGAGLVNAQAAVDMAAQAARQ